MMMKSAIYYIFYTFCLSISVAAPPVSPPWTLEVALERAGSNRPELEEALRRAPGRDMEHLITHATQIDLVTLSANLLETNLLEARKAYTESDLIKNKIDYEMWRDYVLPYRVMEEDLCNWRPYLRQQLLPIVKDASSTPEAASLIHKWFFEASETNDQRYSFRSNETRSQNPLQFLKSGNGSCREFNIAYICALRAVGIPARHCTVSWWVSKSSGHYFAQYYDPDIKDWRAIDATTVDGRDPTNWNVDRLMKVYAFPAYPSMKEIDWTERWDLCTDISSYFCEMGELVVQFDNQGPFTVGLYTWNLGSWRLIAREESTTGNPVQIQIGQTVRDQPTLITAKSADAYGIQIVKVVAHESKTIHLKQNYAPIQFSGFEK
jgi:hypothetical protein